ncbi:MAG: hypothetical protein F4Z41_10205 [Acidimicrobiia bacterium]|nr:hypothetical protein [bacterium]MXX46553.1 hypothetical protein [Acidimicrobiia bacterium]
MVAYPSRPRPPRGKWWLLGLLLVAALGWTLNAVINTSRTEITLGEELRSHTITLDRAARSFVRLIEQIDTADRSELASIITQSRESIGAVTVALEQSNEQDSSLAILLRTSLDLWEEGLERFENAFLSAVDDPFNYVVEEQITTALVSIRSGDRIYQAFLERIGAEPEIQSFSEFRTVVFLPLAYPVVDTGQFLATFARLSRPTLESTADLGIEQVTSHPEWVPDLEGRPVIIPTDSFDLLVVVANRGNVEVVEETSIQLTIWPPGEVVLSRDLTVPPLGPGEKTTVTFFELGVTRDTTYQVEVRLGIAQGEQNLDDNSYVFTLSVGG